jgi:hypothetical protein
MLCLRFDWRTVIQFIRCHGLGAGCVYFAFDPIMLKGFSGSVELVGDVGLSMMPMKEWCEPVWFAWKWVDEPPFSLLTTGAAQYG